MEVLDLNTDDTFMLWPAPTGWPHDLWSLRLHDAAAVVQRVFRLRRASQHPVLVLSPTGVVRAGRQPLLLVTSTTEAEEQAQRDADEWARYDIPLGLLAGADDADLQAAASVVQRFFRRWRALRRVRGAGGSGSGTTSTTLLAARQPGGLASRVVSLRDGEGRRVSVRRQQALRQVVFMWRGFVAGRFPPKVRHDLWLGRNPNGRRVRAFEQAVSAHIKPGVLAGRGVPLKGWARKYPRSICGCTSAYFVPGAMATAGDFAAHRETGLRVIQIYWHMGTELLQLAMAGTQLRVVHGCSGGGGVAAELHLDGMESFLTDLRPQPDAARWYGAEHFAIMDCLDTDSLTAELSKPGTVLYMLAPECDGYSDLGSGVLGVGASKSPQLFGASVEVAQRAQQSTGVPYMAETVGAAAPMIDPRHTVVHRAIYLGVHSEDPHCVQTAPGYGTHVDEILSAQGRWLAHHSCVGGFAQFPKLDNFLRPPKRPCCPIQLAQKLSLHGTQAAPGVPLAVYCEKLGIDPAHPSSFRTLVDMVPPRQGRLWANQGNAKTVHHRLGAPSLTADSVIEDPQLLLIHDLLRCYLPRCPPVARLEELRLLVPRTTHAILVVQPMQLNPAAGARASDATVVVARDGLLLPQVPVEPGAYLVETAYAAFEATFGICTRGTRVQLVGYLPRVRGPHADSIAAVFATGIVTDDLLRQLSHPVHQPPQPLHAGLCAVDALSVGAAHADVIAWLSQHGPDRRSLLADSRERVEAVVRTITASLVSPTAGIDGYVPFGERVAPEVAHGGASCAPAGRAGDARLAISAESGAEGVVCAPTAGPQGDGDVEPDAAAATLAVQGLGRPLGCSAPFTLYTIVGGPLEVHWVYEDARFGLPSQLDRLRKQGSLVAADVDSARPATRRWVACQCGRLVSLQGVGATAMPPADWFIRSCPELRCKCEAWRAVSGLPLSESPVGDGGAAHISLISRVALSTASQLGQRCRELAETCPLRPVGDGVATTATTACPTVRELATSIFNLEPVLLPTDAATAAGTGGPDSVAYANRWVADVTTEARSAISAAALLYGGPRHSLRLLRVQGEGELVLRTQAAKRGEDTLQVGSLLSHEPTRTVGIVVEIELSTGREKKYQDAVVFTYSAASVVANPPRAGDAQRVTPAVSSGRETYWTESGSVQSMLDRLRILRRVGELDPYIRFMFTADLHQHLVDGYGPPARSPLPWVPLDSAGVKPHPYALRMNPSQRSSLADLRRPVEFFQGPPGSGKSTLIAALVTSCVQPGELVLITAPTNKAIDAVVSKLCGAWGVDGVLTVGSGANMLADTRRQRLTARATRTPIYQAHLARVECLTAALYEIELAGGASPDEVSRLTAACTAAVAAMPAAVERAVESLIAGVRVVACTTSCSHSVTDRLARECMQLGAVGAAAAARSLRFAAVVVDEGGALLEPETIFPCLHGARGLAVVGDPAQLPPFSLLPSQPYSQSYMARLERVARAHGEAAAELFGYRMLDTQYRFPPLIGDLVSNLFYEGRLGTHYGDERVSTPLSVVLVEGEERKSPGGSVANAQEAQAVIAVVRALCAPSPAVAVALSRVTVATFYGAQVETLKAALAVAGLPCPVVTVDAMQGSENDVVILSAVRTGQQGFGFLQDAQRLNVALSRCRELLVVVCHPHVLQGLPAGRALQRCGACFAPNWVALRAELCAGEGHGTMEGAVADAPAPHPAAALCLRGRAGAPLFGLQQDRSLMQQLVLARPTPLMALAAVSLFEPSSAALRAAAVEEDQLAPCDPRALARTLLGEAVAAVDTCSGPAALRPTLRRDTAQTLQIAPSSCTRDQLGPSACPTSTGGKATEAREEAAEARATPPLLDRGATAPATVTHLAAAGHGLPESALCGTSVLKKGPSSTPMADLGGLMPAGARSSYLGTLCSSNTPLPAQSAPARWSAAPIPLPQVLVATSVACADGRGRDEPAEGGAAWATNDDGAALGALRGGDLAQGSARGCVADLGSRSGGAAAAALATQRAVTGLRVGPRLEVKVSRQPAGATLYAWFEGEVCFAALTLERANARIAAQAESLAAMQKGGGGDEALGLAPLPRPSACRAQRELLLIPKESAAWVATRGKQARARWSGFGHLAADLAVALALRRRIVDGTTWAASVDGWVGPDDEVLLCDHRRVLEAVPGIQPHATTTTLVVEDGGGVQGDGQHGEQSPQPPPPPGPFEQRGGPPAQRRTGPRGGDAGDGFGARARWAALRQRVRVARAAPDTARGGTGAVQTTTDRLGDDPAAPGSSEALAADGYRAAEVRQRSRSRWRLARLWVRLLRLVRYWGQLVWVEHRAPDAASLLGAVHHAAAPPCSPLLLALALSNLSRADDDSHAVVEQGCTLCHDLARSLASGAPCTVSFLTFLASVMGDVLERWDLKLGGYLEQLDVAARSSLPPAEGEGLVQMVLLYACCTVADGNLDRVPHDLSTLRRDVLRSGAGYGMPHRYPELARFFTQLPQDCGPASCCKPALWQAVRRGMASVLWARARRWVQLVAIESYWRTTAARSGGAAHRRSAEWPAHVRDDTDQGGAGQPGHAAPVCGARAGAPTDDDDDGGAGAQVPQAVTTAGSQARETRLARRTHDTCGESSHCYRSRETPSSSMAEFDKRPLRTAAVTPALANAHDELGPSVCPASRTGATDTATAEELDIAHEELLTMVSDANGAAVARALDELAAKGWREKGEALTRDRLVELVKADWRRAAQSLVAQRARRRTLQRESDELGKRFDEMTDKLGVGSDRELRQAFTALGSARLQHLQSQDAEYVKAQGRRAADAQGGQTLITCHHPRSRDHVFDASSPACSPARFTDVQLLTDYDSDYSELSSPVQALIAGDTGGGQSLLGEGLWREVKRQYPNAIQDVTEEEQKLGDSVLEVGGIGGVNRVVATVNLRFKLAGGVMRSMRLPVVSGFYGLVLGNQFNRSVAAKYTYDKGDPDATFCYHHDYLGVLTTKMEYLAQRVETPAAFLSNPAAGAVVPVGYTAGEHTVPAAVEGKPGRLKLSLRAHTGLEDGATVVMGPIADQRFATTGLIGVASEQVVREGRVDFEVMNVNNYPVSIGELTPVARFQTTRIPSECTVDEVMAAIHIGPTIADSPKLLARLRALVEKHLAVFRKSLRTSYTHAVEHDIVLKPGYKPCKDTPILRRSPKDEARYASAAQAHLDDGVAVMHTGELLEFICNQLLVPKRDADGNVLSEERHCLDLRTLNDNTADPGWPLPDILRNLARLSGWIFWTLDLFAGFNQIPLARRSRNLCAFHTPLGVLVMVRMAFGLKGAPATFCRCIARVLSGVEGVYSYVDDLASGADDIDMLFSTLDVALTRLGESGLGVKPKKVWVGWTSLQVTGFIVSKEGHRPNPERTRPIANWTPQMLWTEPKRKVPQWLGLLNTYNRFIPAFAFYASIIRESVAVGADSAKVMSSLRFQAAFSILRQRLMESVANAVPDYTRRFHVMTDAALSGAATAVLYQVEDDGTPAVLGMWSEMFGVNDKDPIKACSRDFECYAIHQACCVKFAWALEYAELETYVYGDCKALETMMTTKFRKDSRALRMANELSAQRFQFFWRPGHQNSVPDALGRVLSTAAVRMHRLISLTGAEDALATPPSAAGEGGPVLPLVTLALSATGRQQAPNCDQISVATLINEAAAAADERGSGRVVCVHPLLPGASGELPEAQPLLLPAPAERRLPQPVPLDKLVLSTRPVRSKDKVGVVLVHPVRGALVLTSAPYSDCCFPGGYLRKPGAAYRTEAADRLAEHLGVAGVQLAAMARRRKSSLEFRAGLTHYVVYVVIERAAAATLEVLARAETLGDGRSALLIELTGLRRVEFSSADDIRCAGLLAAAMQSSLGERVAAAAAALRAPPSQPVGSCPRGPVYITSDASLQEWLAEAEADIHKLQAEGAELTLAVDLEGRLSKHGCIELVQLGLRRPASESTACVAVIDLQALPTALRAGSTVRHWLESPSIVKAFHNATGDCAALYWLHGVTTRSVADSVVGDSLIRGVRHGTARGLGVVTVAYTGHSLPKGLEHDVELWAARPLAPELVEYAYMDVMHGVELHSELSRRCAQLNARRLYLQLSADRVPPRSLKSTDPAHEPPEYLALLVSDGRSVALLRGADGSLSVPSTRFLPLMDGRATSRDAAKALWVALLGSPCTPVRTCVSSIRRAERVGPLLIHAARLPGLGPAAPARQALERSFASREAAASDYGLEIAAIPDVAGRVDDLAGLAVEWLQHVLRVEGNAATHCQPSGGQVRDDGDGSLSRLTQGLELAESGGGGGVPLAMATAKSSGVVMVAIHDGTFVVLLRHAKHGLTLPALPMVDEEPIVSLATRAIEQQFGPVLKLAAPKFERMFRAALDQGSQLPASGGCTPFAIRVESITDWYAHYHTAFYFRRQTETLRDTLYAYTIMPFEAAIGSAGASAQAVLRTVLSQVQEGEVPLTAPLRSLVTEAGLVVAELAGVAVTEAAGPQQAVDSTGPTDQLANVGPVFDQGGCSFALVTGDALWVACVRVESADGVRCLSLSDARGGMPHYNHEGDDQVSLHWDGGSTGWILRDGGESLRVTPLVESPADDATRDERDEYWRDVRAAPFGTAAGGLTLGPIACAEAVAHTALGAAHYSPPGQWRQQTVPPDAGMRCFPCLQAQSQSERDAHCSRFGLEPKAPHAHCHGCGAVFRVGEEADTGCPCCASTDVRVQPAARVCSTVGRRSRQSRPRRSAAVDGGADMRRSSQRPSRTVEGVGRKGYVCDLADGYESIYYDPLSPPGLQRGVTQAAASSTDDRRFQGAAVLRTIHGGVLQRRSRLLAERDLEYTLAIPGTDYVQCGNPSENFWANYNEDTEEPATHQFQVIDIDIQPTVASAAAQAEARDARAERRAYFAEGLTQSCDRERAAARAGPTEAALSAGEPAGPKRDGVLTWGGAQPLHLAMVGTVQVGEVSERCTVHYGSEYKRIGYGPALVAGGADARPAGGATGADVLAMLSRHGLEGGAAIEALLLRGVPLDDYTADVAAAVRRRAGVGGGRVSVEDASPRDGMVVPGPLYDYSRLAVAPDSEGIRHDDVGDPPGDGDGCKPSGTRDNPITLPTGTRRGRAAYVEEYPAPVVGDRSRFTNLPSAVTPVPQPRHEDALPAAGDSLDGLPAVTREHLLAMQRAEPLISEITSAKLNPPAAPPPKGVAWHLERTELGDDGVLYYATKDGGRRVFLPSVLIPVVCSVYHDRLGHHGHGPTLREISARFYAPKLRSAVRSYCRNCGPCARGKVDRHRAGRPRALYRGEHPWDVVTIDVYTVGYSVDGYDHLVIMVCNLTGWIRVAALKGAGTAEQLLAIFEHEVIRNEGTPRVVRSDQGSNLVSDMWKLFCNAFRIQPDDGSAYTHSTAAIAERFLASLATAIRIHKIATKSQDWPDYVHKIEVSFNFKRGGPFYPNRGRDPRFPYDLALYGVAALRARAIDGAQWLHESVGAWHAAWDARNQVHRLNGIRQVDRREGGRDTELQYQANDPVLLKRFSRDGKWCNPYYDEPYRVGRVLDNGRLELRDLHNRRMRGPVSVQFVKPYPRETNDGDVSPDADECYVEKIVARALVEGDDGNPTLAYKVRFRNMPPADDWWYTADEVPNLAELIREYDTVIKPLTLAERDVLESFEDRIAADGNAAPPRPRRDSETYGARHFRHHPDSQRGGEDPKVDVDVAGNDSEPVEDEPAVPEGGDVDAADVDAADDDAASDDGIGGAAAAAAGAADELSNLLPVTAADFRDDDGVGIHDMRRYPDTPSGQQQFYVGRMTAKYGVRMQWISTPRLSSAERELARKFRLARLAGHV